MAAIPLAAMSPQRAGAKNTCGRPRTLTPRLPVSPPRALAIAVELMKTAEAVATAWGSSRWATMMPRAANTPHTPPMRICPANIPAASPVRAKQRFAPTPTAAPRLIRCIMPIRRGAAPRPAIGDRPGKHPGGGAGQSKAEIRADAERRAEDHQVHHADTAGDDHGHRHQDQLYQRLDADDRAADRRRQMHVVAHVDRQVAVLDRLTRVDEHVQPGEREQRQHLPELRALRGALGLDRKSTSP